MLGPMYWKKPKVEYSSLRAASTKHNNGAVVTSPAPIINAFKYQLFSNKLAAGLSAKPYQYTIAGNIKTSDSINNPGIASTAANFLISPYIAKLIAKLNAIIGNDPKVTT